MRFFFCLFFIFRIDGYIFLWSGIDDDEDFFTLTSGMLMDYTGPNEKSSNVTMKAFEKLYYNIIVFSWVLRNSKCMNQRNLLSK